MSKPAKHCIFCGNTGNITREDVWPSWLSKVIARDNPSHQRGEIAFDFPKSPKKVSHSVKKHSGDPRVLRVRWVCQSCNGGWMSRLQENTKNLIIPLMEGKKVILDAEQQKKLAIWIAMTVMTSEFSHPKNASISFADRSFLKERTLPPDNWKIWIGNFDRVNWKTWKAHHHLLAIPDNGTPKMIDGKVMPVDVINNCPRIYNTQTTTLVFEKLYILAYSSDLPDLFTNFDFRQHDGTVVLPQIWPPRADSFSWPPHFTMGDIEADWATKYIFSFLGGLTL